MKREDIAKAKELYREIQEEKKILNEILEYDPKVLYASPNEWTDLVKLFVAEIPEERALIAMVRNYGIDKQKRIIKDLEERFEAL